MLYHIDGDDREKFLNAGKPDDLPYELADGLDSDFKDFLINKYAVAFLCNSFAGSNKYAVASRLTSRRNSGIGGKATGEAVCPGRRSTTR